jgi:TRAP-type mannitol/chloroaromatic compound transport system substrate-binding protein
MKRRDFLKKAGIGAVAASTVFGPVYAQTAQRIRWRMATSWPRSLDTLFGAAETVAKRVGELTEGRFEIQVFPAGELAPGLQVLDVVQAGNVEMGHTANYYYIGKSPSLAFDTGVPFGLNPRQQNAWLYFAGGLQAMQKVIADFNAITFPAGNTGVQMGGWLRKEVKGPEDLKGLRFRIPGLGGQVMSRLGATVQTLAAGEIFLALDRGAIDAAEFVGPYDDEKLGLNKAARFYYYPGWWEPGSTVSTIVNLDRWRSLPKVYQEAIISASREANEQTMAEYDAKNAPALARLQRAGTQLRPYPTSVLQAANKEATALYEEIAARDATYRGIYESWKKFRDDSRRWFATNEFRYDDFVRSLR